MLREIGSVFSFLTIIPVKHSDLETVAKYMYIFPIVGIVIGLLIGSFAFGLSLFLDQLIVSLIVVSSLAILTGIHHIDGLADFADGIMAKGQKDKKLQAMKDVSTGSAGILSIVIYVVGMILALSLMRGYELFQAILLSEIISKFSMVLLASLGRSAAVGSNSPFVIIMKDKKKVAIAGTISIIPLMIVGGTMGLVIFGSAISFTLIILAISTRSFGGITGDVFGATNEITRLTSLVIFASI
ncbi:MAG TPA: adenosylcobinamide-GDP ribazoletransferase [Nitrosopumilaceae archaeon]|nr:adenosylcobinamide-GDP ribazoletransferase [Nitrosopumilaceae archaeon]